MSEEREAAFRQWFFSFAEIPTFQATWEAACKWQAGRQSAGVTDCPHGVDDGACKQCYAEATGQEVLGWAWERRYSNGGYTRKFCVSERAARELAEDGESLTQPDLVYPFYAASIGDNGRKTDELEKENFALSAGQCAHKGGVMMGEYGHTLCPLTKTDDAQPAESKRVELTDRDANELFQLCESYRKDPANCNPQGYMKITQFVLRLLARAQANGE